MSFTIKQGYGSNGQGLTCTLASLANNGARESNAVDNTSNKHKDALVQVKVKTNAAGTSTTGYINVYAYGTADGGTTYGGGPTGTDAGVTLTSPPGLELIGSFPAVANATTYKSPPMSVAAAFGGVLPDHWGIVVENKSGAALDATEGNHAKFYQGVYDDSP